MTVQHSSADSEPVFRHWRASLSRCFSCINYLWRYKQNALRWSQFTDHIGTQSQSGNFWYQRWPKYL